MNISVHANIWHPSTWLYGVAVTILSMSLVHYFQPVLKADGLPDPHGALSKEISSVAIASANEQVSSSNE